MSYLGDGSALVPGESLATGRKRARDVKHPPSPGRLDLETAAKVGVSRSGIVPSQHVAGATLPRVYAHPENRPLRGPSLLETPLNVHNTPEIDRLGPLNPVLAPTPAYLNDIAPSTELFMDDVTLATLFGFQTPATEPPIAAEPDIDHWAFALGSAEQLSQPSLGDAQEDITSLFGGGHLDTNKLEVHILQADTP